MATSNQVYLTNPTVLIGILDVSALCSSATLTVGYDSLESTSFGDSGHVYVKGLQSVSVELTMYTSYGASSTEAILYSATGTGTTTLVISHRAHPSRPQTPNTQSATQCWLVSRQSTEPTVNFQ